MKKKIEQSYLPLALNKSFGEKNPSSGVIGRRREGGKKKEEWKREG